VSSAVAVVAMTAAVVGVEFRAALSLHGLLCVFVNYGLQRYLGRWWPGKVARDSWHFPGFQRLFPALWGSGRGFLIGLLSVARLIAVDTK